MRADTGTREARISLTAVPKGYLASTEMAVTETTARALRDIQPDEVDPSQSVFGLTSQTLANRVRAAARAAGLGRRLLRTQRPHRHGPAYGRRRRAERCGPAPGPLAPRRYDRALHPGRGGRVGAEVADLAFVYNPLH